MKGFEFICFADIGFDLQGVESVKPITGRHLSCTLDRPRSGMPPRSGPLFLPKTDGSILEDIHPADPQQVFKILSEHKIVLGEFSAAHVVIDVAEHQTYPPNFLPLSIVVIKS